MKLKLTTAFLLIAFSLQSYSQQHLAMFKKDKFWGFIDEKGNEVITPKYSYCRNFYGELAKVDKTKLINSKGEVIQPAIEILDAHHCFEGMVAVKTTNGWGYMDVNGKLVITDKYKKVTDFDNGFAVVTTKKEIFIIDKKGNEIPIQTNEKIKSFKNFSEGMLAIRINDKFGFVNSSGVLQIKPNYITVGDFKNGVAWARTSDKKIGFVNKKGEWTIEPTYLAVKDFDIESGITMVKLESEWEYINMKGESIPIKESNIESFKKFEDGVALAKSNGLWGFLSPNGTWLIQPKFITVTSFLNDYARFKSEEGKWGVINKKGEVVIQPLYANIKPFYIVPN